MRNKKGFTLIELLAVIVILSIIMVIAIPQILNIISGVRGSAADSSIKLLKDAIKTQITASEMMGSNTFTKTGECYVFDFDNKNSNYEALNLKNKDKFTGTLNYCSGEFSDNNLAYDAGVATGETQETKFYLYNKGVNTGITPTTSSSSCGNTHTHAFNSDNITVTYTDQDGGCTGWAQLVSSSSIDFSKYKKAVVVFKSLTITEDAKAVLGVPDNTGWTTYSWFTESKTNAELELDLTNYTQTQPLYVVFTTKPTSGGMNNFNYGQIDRYRGNATAVISQIYLVE